MNRICCLIRRQRHLPGERRQNRRVLHRQARPLSLSQGGRHAHREHLADHRNGQRHRAGCRHRSCPAVPHLSGAHRCRHQSVHRGGPLSFAARSAHRRGLQSYSDSGASVTLLASNSIISHNGDGISAYQAGAKVWASRNTVSENSGFGLYNFGSQAVFESAGNNAVRNNGSDSVGTITVIAAK